jgi:hypothetical protein
LETYEVTALEDAQPRYIPGRWPDGDHQHEVDPPSPEEFQRRAFKLLSERI